MKIRDYFEQRDQRLTTVGDEFQRVARESGVAIMTLYQISLGHKRPSPKLCAAIERATGGAVSRHDLRPDVFDPPAERAA